MTYNRMEAKPILGEYCRFCGDDSLPLVKTKCCNQWVCCDTEFLSCRGGDYCQFEHEHYSLQSCPDLKNKVLRTKNKIFTQNIQKFLYILNDVEIP